MNDISESTFQSAGNIDFSLWGLFANADFIVQFVILLLFAASIWCWTIFFNKFFTFKKISKGSDQFESSFWHSQSIEEFYDRTDKHLTDPMSSLFSSGMREWRASKGHATTEMPQRIEKVMTVTANRELDGLEKNMSFLATVGATAPFIGLFGTVWGIMNSFQGIAMMKSTNLAVVAPGIAEALFATALGLIVAIPAVIAYNKLSSDLNRYANRLDGFIQEFSTLVARKVEGRGQ